MPSYLGQCSLAARLKMLLCEIPLSLPIHPAETLVPTTAFGSLKLPLNREPSFMSSRPSGAADALPHYPGQDRGEVALLKQVPVVPVIHAAPRF